MDEHAVGPLKPLPKPSGRRSLAMGGTRYAILSEDGESCLISAPPGARLRGVADIYEGEAHRDHCLVMLSRSEGEFLRLIYKRRTSIRTAPPADYADETAPPPLDPAEAPEPVQPGGIAGLAARLGTAARTAVAGVAGPPPTVRPGGS